MDSYYSLASMDNQAMRDDAKQSNSTHSNSKVLVRMESAVSSVTSTQELVEGNSATGYSAISTAGKLRAMISSCSRKLLLAFICLLSIGILTMTMLYVLENHRTEETTATKVSSSSIECLEYTPETILTEMPKELKDILPEIESQITSSAQANGFKAVSYGIAYNGKLWWTFHYGRRNFSIPSSPQPNNDTPYPVASLSKLFTAVMLMKLLENGTIMSIDDPIDKYVPEFKVKNPFNKERISFRQLLCMKSGLPREAPCNPPMEFNFCPYNTTEMWRRISNVELEIRPNMASVYSNLGYAVLGRVMGRILNRTSYEDWMKGELFDKIGLRNTGFNVRQRYNSIPASQDADKKISRIIDWGWLRPAGGIYTSMNDLHKFVNVLIERLNTTFLKKSSKRFIFRNEFGEALGCPATIWQQKTGETITEQSIKKYHKQTFYLANGLTIGYTSQIRISPQNTLARCDERFYHTSLISSVSTKRGAIDLKRNALALVATYGLCADGGSYFGFLRLDQRIGEKVYSSVAKALKSKEEKYKAPSNMEAYVGTYKLRTYWPLIRQNLIVRIKNGRLNMVLEWFTADLTYVSPWTLKTVLPLGTKYCKDALLGNGLLNNIYFFQEPADGKIKCPSVYVRSISSFGYAAFVRA